MKKTILSALGAAVFFLLLFHWSVITRLDKPLAHHDDWNLYTFLLEHDFQTITQGDITNLWETRIFYPHKKTLTFGDSVLGQAIVGLPFYLLTRDPVVAINSIILLNFCLGFLAMFTLAFYHTRNILAAILAGVVYTYNPFVLSHFPNHLALLTIQWIPLFFLALNLVIDKVTWSRCLLLVGVFLLQLTSSFYYTFFILVIFPLYTILLLWVKDGSWRLLWNRKLVMSLLLLAVVGYWYLRPFIEVKNLYQMKRSLEFNYLQGAQLVDFFFTSPKNKLYGWMVYHPRLRSLRHPYKAVQNLEHSLFPGITVYIVVIMGTWWVWRRKASGKMRKIWISYGTVLIASAVLALGPYLDLGALRVPMPYGVLFKLAPFTDALRVPSRFIILGFMSLGILVAIFFHSRFGNKPKKGLMVFAFLIVLVTFEYQHESSKAYPIKSELRQFYAWLKEDKTSRVIVELPMANGLIGYPGLERNIILDAQYVFYAIYHDKQLVNGYNGFVPRETAELGVALTVDFPSSDGLLALKDIGVDTIIVHEEEYRQKEKASKVVEQLRELNVEEVYNHSPIHAFRIPSAQ